MNLAEAPHLSWPANRYTAFLLVVVLSAISPAVPHTASPNTTWWLAAAAAVVVMIAVGLAGHVTHSRALNTLAPLLLFPAVHFLRCADGNAMSGFTPLLLLPVIWFALYGTMGEVVLSVVGGMLTLLLPVLIVGDPQYPASGWRGMVLLILVLAVLGPLVHRLVTTAGRTSAALVRSEAEFRAAFEDAPVGMALTGIAGRDDFSFTRVNRALCDLLGRTPQELTSRPIVAFTAPEDVNVSERTFDTAHEATSPRRLEKRYLHSSGRVVWVSVSYSVVRDADGNPSHLVSQIEDIGERRESQQALLEAVEAERAANERLRRLDRMRSEMASTVSHELRTPLTSASGYVDLLLEGDAGPLTDEQLMMLGTVRRSLQRLDGIVDDVLTMAAGEDSTRLQQREQATSLAAVLTNSVQSVALQAATRGQNVRVRNGLGDVTVIGDPGRLERVVVNLLTNAIKFTPEDGAIVVEGERDRNCARIRVIDSGVGISADDRERIFERFYRVEQVSGKSVEGTGLGLAIVQAIATQYGGTIQVDSQVGVGSTFTLTLPVPGA